jgi:hypothetical protein
MNAMHVCYLSEELGHEKWEETIASQSYSINYALKTFKRWKYL